jgi:hypothetical protein
MATYQIKNQPRLLSMMDFLASANDRKGLVKSCRFVVQILPSGPTSTLAQNSNFMREFTYLCESAEFPGRGWNMADGLRYYGPSFKIPYQTEYQETAMTFLCRSESFERQFFDDWMELINPTNTFDFDYKDNYSCKIKMFQFSDEANTKENTEPRATYAWTLHDAWPVLVNPQPVTWADDNFQRLSVSFTYTKWTREDIDPQSQTFSMVKGSNVLI